MQKVMFLNSPLLSNDPPEGGAGDGADTGSAEAAEAEAEAAEAAKAGPKAPQKASNTPKAGKQAGASKAVSGYDVKPKEQHLVHVGVKRNRRIDPVTDQVVYDGHVAKFSAQDFKTFLQHAKHQGVLKISIKHPSSAEYAAIEKEFNEPTPVKKEQE